MTSQDREKVGVTYGFGGGSERVKTAALMRMVGGD
jgi:fructose-1,6-bisphosphatase/sedoheptulose 1,7-bisphosphatase-like protein